MLLQKLPLAMPRAIAGGAIRAHGDDPKTVLAQLTGAFEDFKDRYNTRVDRLEASLDEQTAKAAALMLNGGSGDRAPSVFAAPDPDYSRLMAGYVLNGAEGEERKLREANAQGNRAIANAALHVTPDTGGGYLAPVEWDRQISKAQADHSPMRRIARIQTTETGAYSTLWSDAQWGSGWVGETATRPATSTPELNPIIIPAGEIYANAAATQRILDDAAINIAAWLVDQVDMMFSLQEGITFINGDGVNKPAGLLTFVTGGANAGKHPGGNLAIDQVGITHEDLIDFSYSLRAPYRPNSTWLMSQRNGGGYLQAERCRGSADLARGSACEPAGDLAWPPRRPG